MSSIRQRTSRVADIIRHRYPAQISKMLVVGCGDGREAHELSKTLHCEVIGIDLAARFDREAAEAVRLERADATALPFEDASFDFVYSYHALEHIPNYRAALSEMNRVLKPGGGLWMGTPNRARFVGYLGSEASWVQALRWNLADWRARLQGRFRNELGAHAGFTLGELGGELGKFFTRVDDATLDYYLANYPTHARKVRMLHKTGLGTIAFPSIYFVGRRG